MPRSKWSKDPIRPTDIGQPYNDTSYEFLVAVVAHMSRTVFGETPKHCNVSNEEFLRKYHKVEARDLIAFVRHRHVMHMQEDGTLVCSACDKPFHEVCRTHCEASDAPSMRDFPMLPAKGAPPKDHDEYARAQKEARDEIHAAELKVVHAWNEDLRKRRASTERALEKARKAEAALKTRRPRGRPPKAAATPSQIAEGIAEALKAAGIEIGPGFMAKTA